LLTLRKGQKEFFKCQALVERGASAGSFFTIPPQVQLDIASRKKLITDEHSGRILVDKVLADEESEKMDKLFTSI